MQAIFTLPEINFVGGETQRLEFNLKDANGDVFDADGTTSNFAICSYSNKTDEPLLEYTPYLNVDSGGVKSVLDVTIPKQDTKDLFGKFIYQLTVIDVTGASAIPNQGIMNISKNINKSFIEE